MVSDKPFIPCRVERSLLITTNDAIDSDVGLSCLMHHVTVLTLNSKIEGHFIYTRFIVSEMTYNVSMGTLNPTIQYHTQDSHAPTRTFGVQQCMHHDYKYKLTHFIT